MLALQRSLSVKFCGELFTFQDLRNCNYSSKGETLAQVTSVCEMNWKNPIPAAPLLSHKQWGEQWFWIKYFAKL